MDHRLGAYTLTFSTRKFWNVLGLNNFRNSTRDWWFVCFIVTLCYWYIVIQIHIIDIFYLFNFRPYDPMRIQCNVCNITQTSSKYSPLFSLIVLHFCSKLFAVLINSLFVIISSYRESRSWIKHWAFRSVSICSTNPLHIVRQIVVGICVVLVFRSHCTCLCIGCFVLFGHRRNNCETMHGEMVMKPVAFRVGFSLDFFFVVNP